jgi:D-galacturonate reductase
MKILVIGAGMYVTGRNRTGEGTVLASLSQISKEMNFETVDIVARNPVNAVIVSEAAERINQRIGSKLNVRYIPVTSVADFLSTCSDYDAAIIAVPDHLHYEMAKLVLEHGIHCMIVKPLTPSLAQAKDLVRIQRERGVYAAVEFHKRFDESNRLVKRMISEHTIGNVRYFVINYSQRIAIPLEIFRDWSAKSNIFQYLGVHYVDLVYFLTGARPIRVTAVGTEGVLSAQGLQTYDSVHAIIQWQGIEGKHPFITSMNIGWIDPRCTSSLSDQKFFLVGSDGSMNIDQKNRGIELVKEGIGIQQVNPYFSDYLPTLDGGLEFQGYAVKSIRQFFLDIQSIKNGIVDPKELDSTRPSFTQGLVSTAVIEAVNMSLSRSSEWIDIHGFS